MDWKEGNMSNECLHTEANCLLHSFKSLMGSDGYFNKAESTNLPPSQITLEHQGS